MRGARTLLLVPVIVWVVLVAVVCVACVRPDGPLPRAGWGRAAPERLVVDPGTDGRVRVVYPIGTCVTGRLEVEEFDRASGRWKAHRDGSLLRAGTCRLEDPERLLNELRVRCVDPSGARAPSPWVVGVDIDATPREAGACSPDEGVGGDGKREEG